MLDVALLHGAAGVGFVVGLVVLVVRAHRDDARRCPKCSNLRTCLQMEQDELVCVPAETRDRRAPHQTKRFSTRRCLNCGHVQEVHVRYDPAGENQLLAHT